MKPSVAMLAVSAVLSASAVLAGLMTREPASTNLNHLEVGDLPVRWASSSAIVARDPRSGFVDRVTTLSDGTIMIEGWVRVTDEPFYVEVSSRTAIKDAAGFYFIRGDLPTGEGARGFLIVFGLRSADDEVPCIDAIIGQKRERLSHSSCP